ncbi:DUF2452 domain-containing protein [Thiocystis violacea]|uniref:DUF2452 domain-containing protein n=1 Tax=Thiocystis violacea TaxID=13725 RepID=UPI00190619EC|nr:DUF2452 domain-containing protein [Thiocystis violacea]MBK1720151.1 hypothetical protein [Thiocystis violacea]
MSRDKTDHHLHPGEARSSPYPVSRLAPAFDSGDLAAEVAKAEAMLSARTGAKLRVIADQIRLLQEEARKVLADAQEEQTLTRAACAFKRIPGKTYHLYQRAEGQTFFSMLSPAEWGGASPHLFLGSYRLEVDYSWTPAEQSDRSDETGALVDQLLRIGGLRAGGTV